MNRSRSSIRLATGRERGQVHLFWQRYMNEYCGTYESNVF